MKQTLTQIVALLKKFGVDISPALLAAVFLGIPLLIGLWLTIRKLREKRDKQDGLRAGSDLSLRPSARPPSIKTGALVSVWERFVAGLPGEFRRAIADFQPFVVLGAALSGKTALIQSHTDCQRQQNQFLDSALDDPNLQIHLGSAALVYELSSPLLKDTSGAARKALTRLFRRAFRRTNAPIVVVPLRLAELSRMPPDVLTSQAEVIRGKINLLSWVLDRKIEVRVVLTQLDELEGYASFVAFADKAHVPMHLPVVVDPTRYSFDGPLQQRFAELERYLPLALTQLSAPDYRAVLGFLQAAPLHWAALVRALDVLFAVDPLTKPPIVGGLYLTSAHHPSRGESPFAVPPAPPASRPHPLRNHRIAAALCALVPLAYFAAGYVLERRLFHSAEAALAAYAGAIAAGKVDESQREAVVSFVERDYRAAYLNAFPSFFSAADARVRESLVKTIRDGLLLPGLKRASGEPWAHLRTLYFLGLIYASHGTELGSKVRAGRATWSSVTGLSTHTIEAYVDSSSKPYVDAIDQDALPTVISVRSAAEDETWRLFLNELADGMKRGSYDSLDFVALVNRAAALQASVRNSMSLVDRFAEAPSVLELLVKMGAKIGPRERYDNFFREFSPTAKYRSQLVDKDAVLTRVTAVSLPEPPAQPELLEGLNRRLKLAFEMPLDPTATIRFTDAKGSAEFSPLRWSEVVRATVTRVHILTFIGQNLRSLNGMFFPHGVKLVPFVMNPYTEGQASFVGKASLDGMYTARAFDKYVKPPLEELTRLHESFPEGTEDVRAELDRYVLEELDQHMRAYARALGDFYKHFEIRADFPEAIAVIVRQMLSVPSPFSDFLRTISENANLPSVGKLYDAPVLAALKPYEGFRRLLSSDDATQAAPLEGYRAVLSQLSAALEERGPAEAADPSQKAPSAPPAEPVQLEQMLSPTGRIALTMLDPASQRSYRALVVRWLADVGIRDFMRAPFLAPLREIEDVGRVEIRAAVEEVWTTKMVPSLHTLQTRFPFDRSATVDVSPRELTGILHPLKGEFFELYRQFVKPISKEEGGVTRALGQLSVPTELYPTVSACQKLARLLWSPEGDPKPYRLKVSPVPFETSRGTESVLTLVYLSTGSTSLFNFNQKVYDKTLEIDWMKAQTSQIGVQLTNIDTRRNTYPNPVVVQDSYWSFLRLLERGKSKSETFTWTFATGDDGATPTVARFRVEGDPWAPFQLWPLAAATPLAVRGPEIGR